MKRRTHLHYLLALLWLLLGLVLPAQAQQIIHEQLLLRPGASLTPASVTTTPDGGFVLAGGAFRLPSVAFTHLYVTRLNALGDTLWQHFLPQGPTLSGLESVRADAGGIWLFNLDTLQSQTNPNGQNLGTRLWRLSSAGRVRRVVRPAYRLPGESAQSLLPGPNGDLYALVYNQSSPVQLTSPSILRFDSVGTLRWRHDYAFAAGNYGANLLYSPRGTVLLAGGIGVGSSSSFANRLRLLEVEPSRGDSVGGAALPLAPGIVDEYIGSYNASPYEVIALRQGGYAVPSVATSTNTSLISTGELTRLDAAYNVVWRYLLPTTTLQADARQFTQVRELADGTLLALAASPASNGRTFWLYRFAGATGTLLAVYPFTSGLTGQRIVAGHLLPVAADSSLLVVGRNGDYNNQGVYIARVRVPGLPRVVAGTAGRVVAAALLGVPYPNPASGECRVRYTLPGAGPAQLELRDGLGRLVGWQVLPAGQWRGEVGGGGVGRRALQLRPGRRRAGAGRAPGGSSPLSVLVMLNTSLALSALVRQCYFFTPRLSSRCW